MFQDRFLVGRCILLVLTFAVSHLHLYAQEDGVPEAPPLEAGIPVAPALDGSEGVIEMTPLPARLPAYKILMGVHNRVSAFLKKCDERGAKEWQASTDKSPYYAAQVYTIKTEEDAQSIDVVPTIQKFKRTLAERTEAAQRALFHEKFFSDRLNEIERFVAEFNKIDGYMKSLEMLLQAASPNVCDLYKKWHAVEAYALQMPLYRDFLSSLPDEIEQDVEPIKKTSLGLQLFNLVKKPFQQRLTSGVTKTIEISSLKKNEEAVKKYVQVITDQFLKLTVFINDNAALISKKLTELVARQESSQSAVKSIPAQAKTKPASQRKPVVSVLRQFESAYKDPDCKREAINYWEEYQVEMGEYLSTTLTPFEVLLSEKRGEPEEKQLKAERSVFSWFQPRQDAMKQVLEKCKKSQPFAK